MYATYEIKNGVYFIDCTLTGSFVCGGSTGCNNYEGAFSFASKVAASKGVRLEVFQSV